ncbi:MAG: zinc metallopeptidase [Oscillospiraceae bacterium]|nr:zinc metallopeptidase [Oscillospiraceae bacterium]
MPFYFGIDEYFLLLIVPAMLFSLAMQIAVKSAYKKQSRVRNARGLTGAMAAQMVLDYYGVTGVQIRAVPGRLSDHYDPRSNVIRLSEGVYGTASVAAVGIAAHEAGHAAQHAQSYVPIKVRNAILPVCNIGSMLALPLVILGYWLGVFGLVTLGLALFALIVVFQLVTLPVELNASRRAMEAIDGRGLLEGDDRAGAKKVLTAAAMTYVAALVVSLANLLRLLLRFNRRR